MAKVGSNTVRLYCIPIRIDSGMGTKSDVTKCGGCPQPGGHQRPAGGHPHWGAISCNYDESAPSAPGRQ